MAKADLHVLKQELFEEMKKDFLNQVKKNTGHFHKLKNIKDQEKLSEKFENSVDEDNKDLETTTTLSPCSARVEELLGALLDINGKIADILAGRQEINTSQRDSGISSHSGGASSEDKDSPVQDTVPHDQQHIPMRPNSEYLMERQGAASLTPRRGVNTQRIRRTIKEPEEGEDNTEVKRKSSSSSED